MGGARTYHRGVVHLRVRYIPPDEQDSTTTVLDPGKKLVFGRDPGDEGIQLRDAEETISRVAIELEFMEDGQTIRITNENQFIAVEYAEEEFMPEELRPGKSDKFAGPGWVEIRGGHRIEFEVLGNVADDAASIASGIPTPSPIHQIAWKQLHPNYQQLCVALVAPWYRRFSDRPRRQVPTNQDLKRLLRLRTIGRLNHRVERLKRRLGELLGREFRGPQARAEIADWVVEHRFVQQGDIDRLPGLSDVLGSDDD